MVQTLLVLHIFCVMMHQLLGKIFLLEHIAFDEITTEIVTEIGWIKMLSCIEGIPSPSFTYYNQDEFLDLLSYAISIKIVPTNSMTNPAYSNYTVIAKICSNPVIALNNNKELSYIFNETTQRVTGFANLNNWIGGNAAKQRLWNSCIETNDPNVPRSFTDMVYQACDNDFGIHIYSVNTFGGIGGDCKWEWSTTTGQDIEIYFGFDINQTNYCNDDTYVNIEIYSRGIDQAWLYGEEFSFIKVNGNDYQVLSKNDYYRGLMIVVLDEYNPSILIKTKTFDVWTPTDNDTAVVNWLNSVPNNKIIIMSVWDTADDITQTLQMINLWGCNVTTLGYREAFIFAGMKNSKSAPPSWTYCEKNARFDRALFKTIKLHTDGSTLEPTLNPTTDPTTSAPTTDAPTFPSNTPTVYPTFVPVTVSPTTSNPPTSNPTSMHMSTEMNNNFVSTELKEVGVGDETTESIVITNDDHDSMESNTNNQESEIIGITIGLVTAILLIIMVVAFILCIIWKRKRKSSTVQIVASTTDIEIPMTQMKSVTADNIVPQETEGDNELNIISSLINPTPNGIKKMVSKENSNDNGEGSTDSNEDDVEDMFVDSGQGNVTTQGDIHVQTRGNIE